MESGAKVGADSRQGLEDLHGDRRKAGTGVSMPQPGKQETECRESGSSLVSAFTASGK